MKEACPTPLVARFLAVIETCQPLRARQRRRSVEEQFFGAQAFWVFETESAEPMMASKAPARKFISPMLRGGAVALALLALGGCKIGNMRVHNPIHIKHHRVTRTTVMLPPSNLTTIGVNAYLWRAALDSVSFMPLLQSDANSGVIVTDWYSNPSNPGERMKLTIAILDKDLRTDALRVSASRQVSKDGFWTDAPVAAATVQRLEDVILTKARDLRQATLIK